MFLFSAANENAFTDVLRETSVIVFRKRIQVRENISLTLT